LPLLFLKRKNKENSVIIGTMNKEIWQEILNLSVDAYKKLLEDGNNRVIEIKKGDFYARYESAKQALENIQIIQDKIAELEKIEMYEKNGCLPHTLCRMP
jgi:hypothetical protein